MFEPESIDLKGLPWLPLEDTSAFPSRACIYFAIDGLGAVQYIGRSINARQRWVQHHKHEALSVTGGVKVAYLFVDVPELLPEIEKALIKHFQPPLNFIWNNKPSSRDQKSAERVGIMGIPVICRTDPEAVAIRIFLKESERKIIKEACDREGTNMSHLVRALLLNWVEGEGND